MHITVQLTSHSDPLRGETERMAQVFPVEFFRNGEGREELLRDIMDSIRAVAKAHNDRFKAEHPGH